MSIRKKAFISLMRVLPRQAMTAGVGRLAELPVPAPLRKPIYGGFARAVGANLEESAADIETFETFNAFFTRALREGVRPWETKGDGWAVPADGKLSVEGRIHQGQMIQAKGIDYRVSDFLGEDGSSWEGARFATIYLSPADYHRVHWPVNGQVEAVRTMGGDLWPVNDASVLYVPRLFVENERTVTVMRDGRGRRAAVVMVGATIVGGIELTVQDASVSLPVAVRANEEHGRFHMGSTVVLVVQDKDAPLEDTELVLGDGVRLGQTLWR